MTSDDPKISIHMVASLDGFIAAKDNDISWMESTDNYEKGVTLTEEYIEEFLKNIDCYVIGSRTYEHALELGWVYGDKPVFVLTGRNLKSARDTVEFYSGDLKNLVNDRLKPKYQNIWIAGGASVANDFLRLGLADELIVSILPGILGDGLPFFIFTSGEHKLHLKDTTAYKDGMVELSYQIIKA